MHTTCYTVADVWRLLENVTDPEVPVLSVVDLGVIRHVDISDVYGGQHVQVTITPTYSGCPAMDMIAANIRIELMMAGFQQVEIVQQLSPAWTTDWMSESGKQKLKEYGIAPPASGFSSCASAEADEQVLVPCPRCGSHHTQLISQFGSTACKALYQCLDCKEPFDYFKCH
ncbi:MAG: phenylacetate-CoA oxygenase subunit PaaJ [Chitinophagaceae bacterium]|jgi:ring-1,2-phenylacetyl-CoA epoxidase subunit PaaD|nr:phenylacetate-CoA oxygenase subunit PaaJ [Chitinophagaceae bacterium]